MEISDFTENVEVISELGDKPNEQDGLTSAQLKGKFDQAGKAIKEFLNSTVVPALREMYKSSHSHANKTVLDKIADANVHAHSNKSILDSIEKDNVHAHDNKDLLDSVQEENVHSHDNKDLLDTYTQTNENLKAAVDKKHGHTNKKLLDTLGSDADTARAALEAAGALALLWKNAYETNSFNSGAIDLAGLTEYKLLVIVTRFSTSSSTYETHTVLNLTGVDMRVCQVSGSGTTASRILTIGDDGISVSDAVKGDGSDNAYVIPCCIYGTK